MPFQASSHGTRFGGSRWKIIVDDQAGKRGWRNGWRVSFRVRTKRRPRQINFTVTNYTPSKGTGKGVS